MQVVSKYPDNVFSWVDLSTSDVEGAKKFYGGLFGWEFFDIPSESMPYSYCQLNGYNVAGMGPLVPEMEEQGVPSNWSSYINHSDADSIAKKVTEAGGQVIFEVVDIMDAGRLLQGIDPSGAAFGVWQPKSHTGAQLVNIPSTLTWNELQTRELDSAKEFYGKVFGWTYEENDGGYQSVAADGRVQAGMMAIDDSWGPVPNNWTAYFLVEDVDAAAAKAQELGGTITVPVSEAGDIGRMVYLQDPQGAMLALIEYKGDASPPPGY